jgi:diguanylate cyclase
MFRAIGDSSSKIVELQAIQAQLEEKIRHLTEQVARAEYDGLTNVLGRRALLDRADKLFALARKFKMNCVVGFVDLDDFKGINDRHGHDVGDEALIACAGALRDMVQNRGMVGRCGGDEFVFVMVLPTDYARHALEREVSQAIGALSITAGGIPIWLKSSVGLSWLGIPDEKQTILDAMKQADHQMYAVKHAA